MAKKHAGQKSTPKKTTSKAEPLDLADPDPYEWEPYEGWGGQGMRTQSIDSIVASAKDAAGPAFGAVVKGPDGWNIKASTHDTYVERAKLVAREASAHLKPDPIARGRVTPMEVVERLIDRGRLKTQKRLKLSAWNAYRNGVLWVFGLFGEKKIEYRIAAQRLKQCRHPDPDNAKTLRDLDEADRTQKRGIPKRDLIKLIDQLGEMNRHVGWGARVKHWLQATIITGIRPGEWAHTRWADADRTVLFAPNSKEKADVSGLSRKRVVVEAAERGLPGGSVSRATPTQLVMRAIPVDPTDRLIVQAHLDAVAKWAKRGCPFETYQELARQTLMRACRALWDGEKSYSLYHARHQFAANTKKKIKSRDELAQLMGHANPRTAHRRYARARVAHAKGPQQRVVESAAEAQRQAQMAVHEDGADGSQNNSDVPKER